MPTPLSNEWIDKQLVLCKKATKGPWHVGERGGPTGPFHSLVTPAGRMIAAMIDATPDAHFIAAVYKGYPLVLKEVQRLRALLESSILGGI